MGPKSWPSRVRLSCQVLVSHTVTSPGLTPPSLSLPAANRLPSGEKATELIARLAAILRINFPVETLHNSILLSLLVPANRLPSGEKARSAALAFDFAKTALCFPVATSQSFTGVRQLAVATVLPSGAKETKGTKAS